MYTLLPFKALLRAVSIACLGLLALSCSKQSAGTSVKNEHLARIAGTWTLQARMTDGVESPAKQRLMRLLLSSDGTFTTNYKGEESQGWIRAGMGGFSYEPPFLNLYWENGASVTLLVTELEADRILVHHGRNQVPLKDQEPEEIFVRQKIERGPTRKPS